MDTFPNAKPQSPGESAAAEYAHRSVDEARAGAEEIATQGREVLKSGAERARAALTQTTDRAAEHVQAQPLKSLLIAAAAGAAIALLAGAVGKHHGHH
jgi:ElaB/YqjD/DUF883 family membrane-anchored ribosome-binding protein